MAEVAAYIPGPVGTAAGFISAGAYLATGNTRKAAEMAITGAANMVGAGLAARAAIKITGASAKLGCVGLLGANVKAPRATKPKIECGIYVTRTSRGGVYGLITIGGVAGVWVWAARRGLGEGRGFPMMGVPTPSIRKTSTCLTLPSLALT